MDMTTADPPVVKGSTSGKQNTAITTATTTDVVASPAASTTRNVKGLTIRNKHASTSVDVTVQYNQNATLFELHKATLAAGNCLEFVEGVGFFVLAPLVTNRTSGAAITAQIASHSADTYYPANFNIEGRVQAGSFVRWTCLGLSKTAGTAAPVITVRVGTAGSVADTARATVTLGVQTAVVDQGVLEVVATFRVVGASAVIRADVNLEHNLLITGFATTPAGHAYGGNTGASFDSSPAGSKIGISVNPGTSGAWVVESCVMDAVNVLP